MTELKTTWWNSPARSAIYARWTFLVLINSVFPFALAFLVLVTPWHFIGMLLAIASFVVLYSEFDCYLINTQRLQLSRRLRISAAIKIATPLLPVIDMMCGALSMSAAEWITGQTIGKGLNGSPNIQDPTVSSSLPVVDTALAYVTTMIDGFVLSGIVAIILLLVSFIANLRAKRNASIKAD